MSARILRLTSQGIREITTEDKLYEERMIFITEEINSEVTTRVIRELLCLEHEDAKKEITICITSPGGEVVSGLALYDVIRGMKCPVRTVCIGTAASMGSILFLAGKKRQMLKHSQVMIHDPLLAGLSGSKRALELEKEAMKLMESRAVLGGILAERTGHTLEEVYEKTKEDCYLTAEEALQFGIATEVVERIQ